MDFENIKYHVGLLSPEQLLELHRLTLALMDRQLLKRFPVDLELAYKSFIYCLSLHVKVPPHLGALQPETQRDIIRALDYLLDWCRGFSPVLQRNDISLLFNLFGQLLIQFLQLRQIPISLGSFIRQAKSVPGLVDQAFPGYIPSGLFIEVIVALRNGFKNNEEDSDEDEI